MQTRTPNVRLQPLGQPSTRSQNNNYLHKYNLFYQYYLVLHHRNLNHKSYFILSYDMISKNIIRKYIITYSIIAINIVIFVLEEVAWWSTDNLIAFNFWAHFTPAITYQPRRLFTAMFLHFGIIHLAMNMLALHNIWPAIEKIFWKRKYLLIYLFSGLSWNLTVFWIESITWNYSLSAGASGAIFGILWAYLAITLSLSKNNKWNFDIKQIVSTIVYALIPGFFIPWISLTAHIWWLIWWFIISYTLIILTKRKIKSQSYDTWK